MLVRSPADGQSVDSGWLTVSRAGAVATSGNHTVWIDSQGFLWGIGSNYFGELGDGTSVNRFTPVPMAAGVVSASVGPGYTVFVTADGVLWGVGFNGEGALGDGTNVNRATPVKIATNVAAVDTSQGTTLFLKMDGTLWGMGANNAGQLGAAPLQQKTQPVMVASNVVSFSEGGTHLVFLKSDGSLWAAGGNAAGELGDGTTNDRHAPVQVATGVAKAFAGSAMTFFIKNDGSLWGTGANEFGQLGGGTTEPKLLPVKMADGVIAAAIGSNFALFIKADRSLWAVGDNRFSQLGDGTTIDRTVPVMVSTGVVSVEAEVSTGYFVKSDGSLWGTGIDPLGLLDPNRPATWAEPTQLATGLRATPVLQFNSGLSATFNVAVAGAVPLAFQWQKDGADIPGATSTALVLSNATADAGGIYTLTVTNSAGSAQSSFELRVNHAPSIVTEPQSGSFLDGDDITLTVDASGTEPLNYQWRRNGADIPGEESDSLTLADVTVTDAGDYSVVVTNMAGTVTSIQASVAIHNRPRILESPAARPEVLQGSFVPYVNSALTTGNSASVFIKADGTIWGMGWDTDGQLGVGFGGFHYYPFQTGEGYVSVASGFAFCLYLKGDGSLWAAGNNQFGQLGDGTNETRSTPVHVADGVVSISAGSTHSLFVKFDGSLWGMGSNQNGELGDGTTTNRLTPIPIATGVRSAAAGGNHSLFLKTDGTLWATGSNYRGKLGDGTTEDRHTAAQLASDVIFVAAGGNHTLFIKSDSTLWGVGSNEDGQLGESGTAQELLPIQMATHVTFAAGGPAQTLFVKSDGSLWGTGRSSAGELGDGTTGWRFSPVRITENVLFAASGTDHSLVVKNDGTLWGMGGDGYGQLGLGGTNNFPLPTKVAEGLAIRPSIATDPGTSLRFTVNAVGDGPLTYEWRKDGAAIPGETGSTFTLLGIGESFSGTYSVVVTSPYASAESAFDLTVNVPPVIVQQPGNQAVLVGDPVTLSVAVEGPGPFTYQWMRNHVEIPGATDSSYSIAMAGSGDEAQYSVVVRNRTGSATSVFAAVAVNFPPALVESPAMHPAEGGAGSSFVKAGVTAAGGAHGFFLKEDRSLWAVGANDFGQLGLQPGVDQHLPVLAASSVVSVAAGPSNSLYVRADGTLWGMGANSNGELGDGTKLRRTSAGQIAEGLSSVAMGDLHSLFLKRDGTVWASGWNGLGQIGDGTNNERMTPVEVATDAVSVAAGGSTSLFLKSDGTLWGMGGNTGWNAGDPWTGRSNVPVQLATDVAAMAVGSEHFLYVKTDGTLWGVGENYSGELGGVQGIPARSPVYLAAGVVQVAAGGRTTFFLKSDGKLWGLGADPLGLLGDGTTATHVTPILVAANVVSISTSGGHAYFVKADGTLWSVGNNQNGQLGDGTTINRSPPVQIATGVSVRPQLFVESGDSMTLYARATGTGILSFQWKRDGVAIPGALSNALTIPNAQVGSVGTYEVTVTNAYGEITDAFDLKLNPPLAVEIQNGAPDLIRGQAVTLALNSGGDSYQWRKDGVDIAGATGAVYTIYNIQPSRAGVYTVLVTRGASQMESEGLSISVSGPAPTPVARLINLSTRGLAGQGVETLAVGFYIAGTGSKTVLIRGIGPKLRDYGVLDVVEDPLLRVFSDSTVVGENSDWSAPLAADFVSVGAFALDTGSKDAAMKITLSPGSYTVHLVNGGPIAEALIEIYDLSREQGTRLVNVACRVGIPGDKPVTVGTAIEGGSLNVLTRSVGEGIASYLPYNETRTVVPDTFLRLFSGSNLIGENDDWDASLAPYFATAGAFALQTGSHDSALRRSLAAGGYTVQTSGKGQGGIVLVELYESN